MAEIQNGGGWGWMRLGFETGPETGGFFWLDLFGVGFSKSGLFVLLVFFLACV